VAKYQRVSDADFRENGWDPAQFVEDEDQEGPFAVARLNNAICGCCGGGTTGYTVVNLSTAVGFSQDWTGGNGEVAAQEHAQFLNAAWLQGYSSHGTRGKPVDPTPDPLAEAKERVVEAAVALRLKAIGTPVHILGRIASVRSEFFDATDALIALRTPPDPVVELIRATTALAAFLSLRWSSEPPKQVTDALAAITAIEKARTP
jgi:hypothetical protein